jgi:hypothetical protein
VRSRDRGYGTLVGQDRARCVLGFRWRRTRVLRGGCRIRARGVPRRDRAVRPNDLLPISTGRFILGDGRDARHLRQPVGMRRRGGDPGRDCPRRWKTVDHPVVAARIGAGPSSCSTVLGRTSCTSARTRNCSVHSARLRFKNRLANPEAVADVRERCYKRSTLASSTTARRGVGSWIRRAVTTNTIDDRIGEVARGRDGGGPPAGHPGHPHRPRSCDLATIRDRG